MVATLAVLASRLFCGYIWYGCDGPVGPWYGPSSIIMGASVETLVVRLKTFESGDSGGCGADIPLLPSCRRAKVSTPLGFVALGGRGGGLDRLAELFTCDDWEDILLWFCEMWGGLNPSDTPIPSNPYMSPSSIVLSIDCRIEFLVDVPRSSPLEWRSGGAMLCDDKTTGDGVPRRRWPSIQSSLQSRTGHQFLGMTAQYARRDR